MSLAIEQKVCQTLETSKPTIIYKLLHSVTLSIWFQQNSHRCCLPIKRPFMHGRTCVKNTEWESLVLPNCHMHKLRHGGFNTREGKKGHCCAARDEVGWHAVNSIIKPLLWSHREWRNDIYHNKKKKDCFRISGASLIDEMDLWPTKEQGCMFIPCIHWDDYMVHGKTVIKDCSLVWKSSFPKNTSTFARAGKCVSTAWKAALLTTIPPSQQLEDWARTAVLSSFLTYSI